jgi:hypothetical protein
MNLEHSKDQHTQGDLENSAQQMTEFQIHSKKMTQL